jgi:hypothetical protein
MAKGKANKTKRATDNAVKKQIEIRERLYENFNFESASIQEVTKLLNRLTDDFNGVSLSGQSKTIKFDDVLSDKGKLNEYIIMSRKDVIEKSIGPIVKKIENWIDVNANHQYRENAIVFLQDLNLTGENYIANGNTMDFHASLNRAISKLEQSNLNQDPTWRDGIIPALKQFANFILSLFSNSRDSFWKTSEQKNITEIHRAIDSTIDPGPDLGSGLGAN